MNTATVLVLLGVGIVVTLLITARLPKDNILTERTRVRMHAVEALIVVIALIWVQDQSNDLRHTQHEQEATDRRLEGALMTLCNLQFDARTYARTQREANIDQHRERLAELEEAPALVFTDIPGAEDADPPLTAVLQAVQQATEQERESARVAERLELEEAETEFETYKAENPLPDCTSTETIMEGIYHE